MHAARPHHSRCQTGLASNRHSDFWLPSLAAHVPLRDYDGILDTCTGGKCSVLAVARSGQVTISVTAFEKSQSIPPDSRAGINDIC